MSDTWRVVTGRGGTAESSYSKTNSRLAAKAVAHNGIAAVAEDTATGEAYLYIPDDSRPFGWDEEGGPVDRDRRPGWWESRLSEKRTVIRTAPRFVVVCDGTTHKTLGRERGGIGKVNRPKKVGPCPGVPACPAKVKAAAKKAEEASKT